MSNKTQPKTVVRDGVFDDYTGPNPSGKYPCEEEGGPCGCGRCADQAKNNADKEYGSRLFARKNRV